MFDLDAVVNQKIQSYRPYAAFFKFKYYGNMNCYLLSMLQCTQCHVFTINIVRFGGFGGNVHGVFLRKSTVLGGKELGLCGWSMNTERGTVIGKLEGPSDKMEDMKKWLKSVGSRRPKIQNVHFRKEGKINTNF